mmetsp:Transcript_89113/g.195214  ORF Transcript_89113/g.195214 Transcript_89113/m.195214 type:complete len:122 (+) Transcript_89113:3135-3500(+)
MADPQVAGNVAAVPANAGYPRQSGSHEVRALIPAIARALLFHLHVIVLLSSEPILLLCIIDFITRSRQHNSGVTSPWGLEATTLLRTKTELCLSPCLSLSVSLSVSFRMNLCCMPRLLTAT